MSRAATRPFRVTCPDFTKDFAAAPAAQRWAVEVETSGKCHQLHTVEVRVADEWLPLHIHHARQILAAPVGPAPIDTPDGPLVKNTGGHATLTADGRGARVDGWCGCAPQPEAGEWVRYERWSPRGREAHGFVCPGCRLLVQVG